jgi:hypothetical protein
MTDATFEFQDNICIVLCHFFPARFADRPEDRR